MRNTHYDKQNEITKSKLLINKELALKESLMSELLKHIMQETAESRRNAMKIKQEIKQLHAEKEENLQVVHVHNVSSK